MEAKTTCFSRQSSCKTVCHSISLRLLKPADGILAILPESPESWILRSTNQSLDSWDITENGLYLVDV